MKKSTWIWIGILAVFIGGGLLYRHFAQEVDSRGATRLMRALEENDAEKSRQLLEEVTDINTRDKSGQTALFYAARYTNDPILLHKLVAAGADTFAKDKHGYTPLMAAAEQNSSPRIVMALARYGRFLKGQDENKNQALAVAAQHNTAAIIKTLLIAGANPLEAEAQQKNTADLLAENPQLTEQEKTDLRQIMLVLEILQAREEFRQENYPQPAERKKPALPQGPAVKMPAPAAKPEVKQMAAAPQETAPASAEVKPLLDTPADKPLVNLAAEQAPSEPSSAE